VLLWQLNLGQRVSARVSWAQFDAGLLPRHARVSWVQFRSDIVVPHYSVLLEGLARVHGLIDTLTVTPTSRGDGVLVQSVSGSNTVTVTTASAPAGGSGPNPLSVQETSWLVALARLHGLIEPLVVTPTSRTAGPLAQTISSSGDTVTVNRVT
jgi:hypothetical protein